MHILAIETATDACSAALLTGDAVGQEFHIAPREHARLILPMIERLLAAAELTLNRLDAVAFGRGPGSFTGLRIAAGVSQGIAFAADLPVVPVSTLAALAQGCVREHDASDLLIAQDARMHEVYWGVYTRGEDNLVTAQGSERVCPPSRVVAPDSGRWVGAGSGWEVYRDTLQACCGQRLTADYPAQRPQAEDIARLAVPRVLAGQTLAADQAQPVYLRDRVADKPKPRQAT